LKPILKLYTVINILLELGLIALDDNGNIQFEIPNSLDELKDILKRMGINSIAHSLVDYFRDRLSDADVTNIISAILLSGHFKSIIKGTRIPVALIYELVGLNYTIDEIQKEYPHLDRQILLKVIEFLKRSQKLY